MVGWVSRRFGVPRLQGQDRHVAEALRGEAVGLGIITAAREAARNLGRQLGRTMLCALGTTVAVVAFVVINGLSASAGNAVLSSFNALAATTVEFQGGTSHAPLLTDAGVLRLSRLDGVIAAGLIWDINGQQPYNVTRTPGEPASSGAELSFTAASPSAFPAIGATVVSGRTYDYGAEIHHEMVAMLGFEAARALGISSVRGSPAIFVDGTALTVVGIIGSAQQAGQVLANVVVPPYVASVISAGTDQRSVIVRTKAGAAQLIGAEGPLALNPYHASAIVATVPPDPSTLRASVAHSLTDLLRLVELVGLGFGVMSIAALTVLSVNQRRPEIGLLRAVGYRRVDVARQIALEAVAIGFVGGVLGTSLGLLGFVAVAASQGWTPVIPTHIIVIAPLLGIATGVVAGAYPAFLVMQITPMAALRS